MKLWITLIIIAVVLIGGFAYTKRAQAPETATTTPSVATTTESAPAGVMEDGAGGPEVAGVLVDGTYTLDTEKSKVGWTGSKTLIKNYTDHGTLSFTSGSTVVANGHVTSGDFVIDMNSFAVSSTSNTKATGEMLAGHLKSADFFDVATYPTATVKVKNVVNNTVTADVTIKGITKTISFPATISQDGTALVGSATLTLDRTNWDIRYGSTKFFGDLGNSVIDDKVLLDLTLYATKK